GPSPASRRSPRSVSIASAWRLAPVSARASGAPSLDVRVRRVRRASARQYASDERTSPPLRLPSAHHVRTSMLSLMKRTAPWAKPQLTPRGWLLLAVIAAHAPPQPGFGSLG